MSGKDRPPYLVNALHQPEIGAHTGQVGRCVRKSLMNGMNTRRRIATAATVFIAFVIAALTLMPVTAPDIIGQGRDTLSHVIAFASLTFPMAFLNLRRAHAVLVCAILFGAAIELIQPSVGRTGSFWDFLADVIGAVLGLVAGRILGQLLFAPKTGQL